MISAQLNRFAKCEANSATSAMFCGADLLADQNPQRLRRANSASVQGW